MRNPSAFCWLLGRVLPLQREPKTAPNQFDELTDEELGAEAAERGLSLLQAAMTMPGHPSDAFELKEFVNAIESGTAEAMVQRVRPQQQRCGTLVASHKEKNR